MSSPLPRDYSLDDLARDLTAAGFPTLAGYPTRDPNDYADSRRAGLVFDGPFALTQTAYGFPYRLRPPAPDSTLRAFGFPPRLAASDLRLVEWSSHPDVVQLVDADPLDRLDLPRANYWNVVAQSAFVLMGYRNWHERYLDAAGWERVPRHVTTDETGGIWVHPEAPPCARRLSRGKASGLPAALAELRKEHAKRPAKARVAWHPELAGLLAGIADGAPPEPTADWLIERTGRAPRPDARLGDAGSVALTDVSLASMLAHIATAGQLRA